MFVITREKIKTLKERLSDPDEAEQCLEDVKKVLEIKETLLWRAEVGSCCAGPGLAPRLFEEVRLLEATANALKEGNITKASLLFEDFASRVEYV